MVYRVQLCISDKKTSIYGGNLGLLNVTDIPGAVAAVPTQSSEKVLIQPSEADSPPESISAAAPGHSKRAKVLLLLWWSIQPF